jgi:hypothetical protein
MSGAQGEAFSRVLIDRARSVHPSMIRAHSSGAREVAARSEDAKRQGIGGKYRFGGLVAGYLPP